ncbi:E3 binding domain-containing protein [Kallotenue papyrolyticum]|uniref:E3 binding domain-containing protein n=1 Tax=Kallotenue papyrolyticum TaxID=1325125 RepID=UPI000492E454|nr:E3 binding domain-containing protein [Kallotenue papyrolyticum]
MPEMTLPPLDASTATVERYYVQPGAAVRRGQPLVIVVTQRFEWELPATAEGTLVEILAPPGTTVSTGQPLARLATADQPAAGNGQVVRATPLARRIAQHHGLDLAAVTGSGPGGRITRSDVLQRLPQAAASMVATPVDAACFGLRLPEAPTLSAPLPAAAGPPAPATVVGQEPARQPLSAAQRLVADAALQREALPYAIHAVELDLSRVLAAIAAQRLAHRRHAVEVTPLACVVWAVAQTLLRHRLVNSVWSPEGVIVRGRIRLAVVRHDGHTTLIEDAPDLSVQGIARRLAADAHQPVAAASFTIQEVAAAHWSALPPGPGGGPTLSLGAITPQARVVETPAGPQIAPRPCALLSLAYDARLLTPPQADAFLLDVQRRLELFTGLC